MKFILPELITSKGGFFVTWPVLGLALNIEFNLKGEIEAGGWAICYSFES